jgi:carboxyl-terminal processing protease
MMRAGRLVWLVGSTILLSAMLGGMYGQQVEATANPADDSDVRSDLSTFGRVLSLVQENYADPVDPDKAIFGDRMTVQGAIPGMLRQLDPHSSFLDPRTFEMFKEEQEGKYFGVGMRIGPQVGRMGKIETVVVLPIPGSPALRAGIRPGDIIVAVDGKSTDGLDTDHIAKLLKGPKDTKVSVTMERAGYDQPLTFALTRAEISQQTVQAFMLRPEIAYIKITGFNEETNDELSAFLGKLDAHSLEGVVLDLRDNPGGLLQQAVAVADHFLQKGQLVVYHSGRRTQERRWRAENGNGGVEYPMVVLINRMTASAAEIVSGALQDHDRALVVGEPSFGKGLVQSEYPLSERTMLLLTTAHYFTPSGRLIQRNYADASPYDYYYRYEGASPQHTDVRLTDGGREVYGGGGITPDVPVRLPKSTSVEDGLTARGTFDDFARSYLGVHKSVPRTFAADDAVIQEFRKYLAGHKILITDQQLKDNLDFIKDHIQARMIFMVYGQDEQEKVMVSTDPLVEKALQQLPHAGELIANARKFMASRDEH